LQDGKYYSLPSVNIFYFCCMEIPFFKYQGTGNDFILLDNREGKYGGLREQQVASLCNRRFGIGADGLMLLNAHPDYDFEMVYFNADGREGSMCGNGGRCIVRFACDRGIQKSEYRFLAVDGPHLAKIDPNGWVSLRMIDVDEIRETDGDFLLNTGSPHLVRITADVSEMDVYRTGMEIRYSPAYSTEGINVNFAEQKAKDRLFVRTYERGVEDETFSCGTGVTAAALTSFYHPSGKNSVHVQTKGGMLRVDFERDPQGSFHDIWLNGPAAFVFKGTIPVE